MIEPIGQQPEQFEGATRVVVPERPQDRALSHVERQTLRASRLTPTYHEAVRRHREAEDHLDWARDALGTAATNLLLGDASEDGVREIEGAIAQGEREVRRWKAAMHTLDGERGVIRDDFGNRL